MNEVKSDQVNEISGGATPGTLGEILESGYLPLPFGPTPYNPDGPGPNPSPFQTAQD